MIPRTVLKPRLSYHVYMEFFDSAINFWLQLVENSDLLDTLNAEITSIERNQLIPMPVNQVTTGTICITYATEYVAYYRAVVSNVQECENKCAVTYVDYGNNEEKKLAELYVLHDRYTILSSQGIQCCLFSPNAKLTDMDRHISSEQFQPCVMKVTSSGLDVVTLQEKQPVSTTLVQYENKQKITSGTCHYTPVLFNLGSTVHVCISHIEDSWMFTFQLIKNRIHRCRNIGALSYKCLHTCSPVPIGMF